MTVPSFRYTWMQIIWLRLIVIIALLQVFGFSPCVAQQTGKAILAIGSQKPKTDDALGICFFIERWLSQSKVNAVIWDGVSFGDFGRPLSGLDSQTSDGQLLEVSNSQLTSDVRVPKWIRSSIEKIEGLAPSNTFRSYIVDVKKLVQRMDPPDLTRESFGKHQLIDRALNGVVSIVVFVCESDDDLVLELYFTLTEEFRTFFQNKISLANDIGNISVGEENFWASTLESSRIFRFFESCCDIHFYDTKVRLVEILSKLDDSHQETLNTLTGKIFCLRSSDNALILAIEHECSDLVALKRSFEALAKKSLSLTDSLRWQSSAAVKSTRISDFRFRFEKRFAFIYLDDDISQAVREMKNAISGVDFVESKGHSLMGCRKIREDFQLRLGLELENRLSSLMGTGGQVYSPSLSLDCHSLQWCVSQVGDNKLRLRLSFTK